MADEKTNNPLRIVFWETTVRCNLSCGHCRRLSVQPTNELTSAEGRDLIDQLAEISATQSCPLILIFSGGEPLLREDLFELAKYARQRQLATALASNGTLIDPLTAKKIVQADFGRVAVSLDGPSWEIHDRIRQLPGCFDRAVTGIQNTLQAGTPVQINTTVSRSNLDHMPAMLDLARELKAVAWHVFVFVPVGCGSELPADEMLTPGQAEKVLHWLYEVSRQNEIQIKPTCAPQYYRILARNNGLQSGSLWHRYTRGCLAGVNVCFVSATGKVFPCGYLPAEAGDLRKERMTDIWQESQLFRQLRDYDLLKGKCGGCGYVRDCGGCRARAFGVHQDFLAEDPGCSWQS
jgi:radical SAM protein with 4Fe4S-binding SPASM domain